MSQLAVGTVLDLPFKLKVQDTKLTEEQFLRLCQENRDLCFELTSQKELVILPPAGAETGRRNNEISYFLTAWTKQEGTGFAFGFSAGFTLPNGAIRSPDASWVKRERWEVLTKGQRERFAPLCPDFVIELRSPSDQLSVLQEKMQEYIDIDNGARLGWLIDPIDKRVHIYRPNQPIEILDNPSSLTGDPVLPGFVLPVHELW
jgi:Uma2 family endonuclease